MPTARDVQTYVRALRPDSGAIQLMKWTTISFGGHLHWQGEELFPEHIQPWKMGPAIAEIWDRPNVWGNASNLSTPQQVSIRRILEIYGHMSGTELIALTHKQQPWIEARKGVTTARSTRRITPAAIAEYYNRTQELERDELREEMTQHLCKVLSRK